MRPSARSGSLPICTPAAPPDRARRITQVLQFKSSGWELSDHQALQQDAQTQQPARILLPLLPLRDVVVFPHMVIPLFVGRPKSIKAMEIAMEAGKSIILVAQKSASKDEPAAEDMFDVGCVSTILQMLKLPDGTVKVLVEGQQRALVKNVNDEESHFTSSVVPVEPDEEASKPSEIEALRRAVTQQFDQYVKLNKKIPPEILTSIGGIDDPGRLADTIAAHLPLKLDAKQAVLDLADVAKRLEKLLELLEHEVDILQVEKRIRGRVKRQMEKSQREYYLNEQVKAIQKELGDGEDGADMEELEKKILAAKMPKEARKKADAELKKLERLAWPAEVLQVAEAFLRARPDSAFAPGVQVARDGARTAVRALQRSDVRLFKAAFATSDDMPADQRQDLLRCGRGDKDAAARMAWRYREGARAGAGYASSATQSRYEGWLQFAVALGNGIASYELALHFRNTGQPLLAAQFEARARELGYTPPPDLDNVRK